MWQDYIGIIPGVAAAILGVVTLMTRDMPRWQIAIVIALTVIAVGSMSLSQWWILHKKAAEQAKRTEIEERFGQFIGQGESLITLLVSHLDQPVPETQLNEWATKTETFLQTLGVSYVTRFRSGTGLNTSLSLNGADAAHNSYWLGMRSRLIRLHAFASEFAGQIPSDPSPNPPEQ